MKIGDNLLAPEGMPLTRSDSASRGKAPMKIVHAASELYPYLKTGGLADAVGALTSTLANRGHEVSVFLPG